MFRFVSVMVSLLRVALVAGLTFVCAQALPSWDADVALMSLPNYDYYEQAETLRMGGRYTESLLVIDAGLAAEISDEVRVSLTAARARVVQEKEDWLRRLGEAGEGALTGTGESVEALAGAVVADLFVFGDIRDLVIQGGHKLQGEEVDEVIVGLSAAGIVLTATPTVDFGTAVLKFARRTGALSEAFARRLMQILGRAVQEGEIAPVIDLASDTAKLGRAAQPAVAVAILKNIDDPQTLASAARLAQRPGGSFALWVGERPGLDLLKAGAPGESLLLRAAAKGRSGIDFAVDNLFLLTRAHPLLGLIKSVYRYNLPRLLERLLAAQAPLILGLVFGWLIYECLLLAHRVGARRQKPEPPAGSGRIEPRTNAAMSPDRRNSNRREPVV